MIAEAIEAMEHVVRALAVWIVIGVFVGTVVLLSGLACGTWAVKRAWRALSGPSWARGRLRARILARRRTRASEERTEAPDYQEAA